MAVPDIFLDVLAKKVVTEVGARPEVVPLVFISGVLALPRLVLEFHSTVLGLDSSTVVTRVETV